MIGEFSSRARRKKASLVVALSLLMSIGIGGPRFSQAATGEGTTTGDARAADSQSQSLYSAAIANRYPTVRALVVSRGDCIIFEYYRKDINSSTRSPVYSVTKSVLSILVGVAIDKGYLRLDQKLSELLPETFEENVDPLARDITVRDLLTKTEGFDPAGVQASHVGVPTREAWRWMLYRPMKYAPGTHFNYDGAGANLLSVVLSRAIKQDAERFAQQNFFDPLQIDNLSWVSDAEGNLMGETDLFLTARDMAKIGILYLQHGRWGDKQIVSEDFVRDSTAKHNDGGAPVNAAYGYLWWITTKTDPDAFFAAGHNSQLIYVVPKRDLVVAVAAESIPGGSVSFANDVVLPDLANSSTQCLARLQ
jgi:CubicO group peptidase (beta-lactamase class C family)